MDQSGKPSAGRTSKPPARLKRPDLSVEAERREKIAKLKKEIEDGTYQVSSDEVARKLIEHMLEPKE